MKRLQTDRPSNRPTCAKQYALSSSKGGIKTMHPFSSREDDTLITGLVSTIITADL